MVERMSIFSIEVTWLACRRLNFTFPRPHHWQMSALCLPQWQTKLNAIWCVSCTPRRYWWKCVVIIICDNWWAKSIFLVVPFSVVQMELQQFSKRPTARTALTVNKYMSRMAFDALQRHAVDSHCPSPPAHPSVTPAKVRIERQIAMRSLGTWQWSWAVWSARAFRRMSHSHDLSVG